MGDIVVRLPVHAGEEAQLFGSFLSSYIERSSVEAEVWAKSGDAPYLMVRSDPQPDVDVKILIFQESSAASDFSQQWEQARTGLTDKVVYRLG
jgi:hypothetical protein